MTQSMSVLGLRFSRTATDGSPDWGNATGSIYICSGVRSVQMTDELETGDDIAEQDGAGRICLTRKYSDKLKRVTLAIELCDDSRRVKEITGNGSLVTVNGQTDGGLVTVADTGCSNPTPQKPVILEVYVENWNCAGPADYPYKVFVFPRVFLRGGDRTFQKGIVPQVFNGFAESSNKFDDGPFGDYDELSTAPYFGTGQSGFVRYEKDLLALPSSADCGFYAALPASSS